MAKVPNAIACIVDSPRSLLRSTTPLYFVEKRKLLYINFLGTYISFSPLCAAERGDKRSDVGVSQPAMHYANAMTKRFNLVPQNLGQTTDGLVVCLNT
jgi:hypothetical protein